MREFGGGSYRGDRGSAKSFETPARGISDQINAYIENGGNNDAQMNIFVSNGLIYRLIEREKGELSNSQIRKFYDDLIKVKDANDQKKLIKIELSAAYAKGRGVVSYGLYDIITKSVESILKSKDNSKLERFKNVFEAIVAYHTLITRSKGGGNE